MALLVVGYVVLSNGMAFLKSHHMINPHWLGAFPNLLAATRIDCMAIGGIGAYAFHVYPQVTLRLISSKILDMAVAALVLFLIIEDLFVPYIGNEVFGVLFCYLILSASCKKYSILELEGRMWNWLGKLSYGIYMWHMVVLAFVILLLKKAAFAEYWMINGVLYLVTPLLTIIVAWLSYKYIEKPFLSVKNKFVLVKSRAS